MNALTVHMNAVLLGAVLFGAALVALLIGFIAGRHLKRRDPHSPKQPENVLESGDFCKLLLNNSPDAFVIVDDTLAMLMVNDAYCRMTGRTKEEVLGKRPPFPGWPNDNWASVEPRVKEMLGDRIKPFQHDMYTKSGDRFPALFSVSHVRAGDGKLYHFIIIKDVTENKNTELALRESEAKFRAQYMGIPIPVYTWRRHGDDFVLTDWNLAAERITDGAVASFIGARASDMYKDAPDILAELTTCFSEQRSLKRDMQYRFKLSPRTVIFSVTYSFVPPDYVLVHTEDITARTEAEQKLKESESRFRAAVESLPFDFFMLGQDGRYVMMNSAARDHWGLDAIGRRPEELAPDSATAELWAFNNRRAFSGDVVSGEVNFKVRGEERHYYNIISPVYDGDRINGILGANIDITKQKRAEHALRESEEQLRALAKRLHQIREEESTKIAREIHDELGQSLTGLKLDLSRLGKQIADSRGGAAKEHEEKIRSMTQAVDATIQRVREISAQLRPLILDDLGLAGAIEWQAQEFEQRTGIRCDLNQDGFEEQEMHPDAQRSTAIFRILQEILTNVGRHAEARNVLIDVRREGADFCLEVADDGKGFSQKGIKAAGGLGILGMNERAQAFGGTVSIHSDAGTGTRVRVSIPFSVEN